MPSKIFNLIVSAFIVLAVVFLTAASAQAQLVILDCQGITRAIHESRGVQSSRVEVQVSEPGGAPNSGSQVQLTNNVNGKVYSAQSNGGTAVFDSIPPGNYSMAVTGNNLTIGTITIVSTGLGVAAASGVLAGGALAGGGAIAGGAAAVDSISNDSGSDPTPTATPTPVPETPATPTPSTPTAVPTPTPTCDCDPDAEPTPVDDFFDDQSPTPAAARAKALSPYR